MAVDEGFFKAKEKTKPKRIKIKNMEKQIKFKLNQIFLQGE